MCDVSVNQKLTLSRSLPLIGFHLPPLPGIVLSEEVFSVYVRQTESD